MEFGRPGLKDAEQDRMQRAGYQRRGFDREKAGMAVAGSRWGGHIGLAVMVMGMAGINLAGTGMGRVKRAVRSAGEGHDREMQKAHRGEQHGEARAQGSSDQAMGRSMHKSEYKGGRRVCHRPRPAKFSPAKSALSKLITGF